MKYPPLSCLIIAVDLSDHRQKKCSIWTVTHHPWPISQPLFNLWFSSLHLAWLHTTHHVKDWNTQAESLKEDSQGRKSTWCSSVVRRAVKSRIEPRGYTVCSLDLLLSEPIKNSLERDRGCVYGVGVLCMFLCVCVETGGPKASCWCWGARLHSEISHTAVWGVCVHTGGVLLCTNVWHSAESVSMWQASRLVCKCVSFHVHLNPWACMCFIYLHVCRIFAAVWNLERLKL